MYNESAKYNENADMPARETEISKVMGKLNMACEMLAKEFSALEERVSLVMRGGTLNDEVEKAANPEYSSGLAQDINNVVRRLNSLHEHMNSVRNRIEL